MVVSRAGQLLGNYIQPVWLLGSGPVAQTLFRYSSYINKHGDQTERGLFVFIMQKI